MKEICDYITESLITEGKIDTLNNDIAAKYDVNLLYHYENTDEVVNPDDENEVDTWIDEEIEQIIIDVHNATGKPAYLLFNSKKYKDFIKAFAKEYKDQEGYEIAMKLYNKLLNVEN